MRVLLFFIFLAACGSVIPVTPGQTQKPKLKVNVSPSSAPVYPALVECSSEMTNVYPLFYDDLSRNTSVMERDILIQLGEPEEMPGFAAVLGWEEIVLVVHPDNSIQTLSTRQIQSIFSGRIDNWERVGGEEMPLTVWAMLLEDEVTELFVHYALQGWLISPNGRLAPSASAMLEAVANDPTGIGYLPKAWVTDQVKFIETGLVVPVLALVDEEPIGPSREFLGCLQSGVGEEKLLSAYP